MQSKSATILGLVVAICASGTSAFGGKNQQSAKWWEIYRNSQGLQQQAQQRSVGDNVAQPQPQQQQQSPDETANLIALRSIFKNLDSKLSEDGQSAGEPVPEFDWAFPRTTEPPTSPKIQKVTTAAGGFGFDCGNDPVCLHMLKNLLSGLDAAGRK